MAKVSFDEVMDPIDHRGQENGHGKLVYIVYYPNGQHPDKIPVRSNIEGDDQDDKAVDKLGYEGRTGGA